MTILLITLDNFLRNTLTAAPFSWLRLVVTSPVDDERTFYFKDTISK